MRPVLRLLACLALTPLVHAAMAPTPFTAKERAQGYRDHAVLAKPRAEWSEKVEAAEVREGMIVNRRFSRVGNLRVLRLPSTESTAAALKRLRASNRYEYVEPDRILHARRTPTDASFSQQWSFRNTGQDGGTSGADIRATTAWDKINDASSVIVAVIDSGIRLDHQDLSANLWKNSSGQSGISAIDGNGVRTNTTPNDSDLGHGTHVAGIIGAVGNNSVGVSGIAWKTKLMALRFLHGDEGEGTTSDSIACMEYAIQNGAKVINASYGSNTYSQAEFDAINAARRAGVIVVVAAGNESSNSDLVEDFPSGYALDNIVTVAATDRKDHLSDFSNYGGIVDLAAPGSEILSTYNGSRSDYAILSGTSMSAPHVTGALALLRARYPKDNYRQSINRLLGSVKRISALSGKVQTGGRLDLATAVNSSSNRPFNDSFSRRAKLTGSNVRVRSSNTGASRQTGEPSSHGSSTLWWTWKAPASTQVAFDTVGSAYDTRLAVYTGSAVDGLTRVGSNDNASSSVTTSRLVLNVKSGTTYQIAVGSRTSATGFTALRLDAIPANDSFSKAKQLSSSSQLKLSGTTRGGSRESNEPRAVTGASGHSVWYKWVAPQTAHYSLAAFATQIDTVAAVYTGSSVSKLKKIASNDNNQGADNSDALVSFNAKKGTTYYLQLDDYAYSGSEGGEFILTLTDSLWEFPTFDEVTSSPAVATDGTVYFGSLDGYVYAVNPNGTKKWQYPSADSAPVEGGFDGASPAIAADGTVLIGGYDNYLYAINPATGARKWRTPVASPIASTPAIAADKTIYVRDDTKLYAFVSSGIIKWTYPLTGSTTGTYSSPVIGKDGTIYVGTNGGLHAIKPDGTRKWRYTTNDDVYTSIAIGTNGVIYLATLKGTVYAVTDKGTSGSKKWSWSNTTQASITSSIAIAADGTLYLADYDGNLHALTSAGKKKWSYKLGDEVRASSPAIDEKGSVYIGAYDGKLYAIRADGTRWRVFPTALSIRSSPVIVGKRLYFGSADAKLHAFALTRDAATGGWPMFHANAKRTGRAP